jgi:hypothetical protein
MDKFKKYKFINMASNESEEFNGKPVYRVFNNKSNGILGVIFYNSSWKQFVFSAAENCIFSVGCLNDIIDFIENEIV